MTTSEKADSTHQPIELDPKLPLSLPALPFDPTAFGSFLSEETFTYHHRKHHQHYIDVVNELSSHSSVELTTLELAIKHAQHVYNKKLLDNAMQVWNHSFQWLSLVPHSELKPGTQLYRLVLANFGSLDSLAVQASEKAAALFGSGWLWLVMRDGHLDIETTHDAARPEPVSAALLTADLWEHAYYLDHQNRRQNYVKNMVLNHWNWQLAESRLID